MFADYVFNQSPASYSGKILIIDKDNLIDKCNYLSRFEQNGYAVICYKDDLDFRINYSSSLEDGHCKYVVLAYDGSYIPYDIRKAFELYEISFAKFFPKLNSTYLKANNINLDLLVAAYQNNFDEFLTTESTKKYVEEQVKSKPNILCYVRNEYKAICYRASVAKNYYEWFDIAEQKANLLVRSIEHDSSIDWDYIDLHFINFILENFGSISSNLRNDSPVLVSKAMDFMHENSEKFAVIVMDGMSEFDWEIIATSFDDLKYHKSNMFAMIPTTTSVSRQCLLSNKYPNQLISPWTQSKEKDEFISCARDLGYQPNQIEYHRGYDVAVGLNARCVAIIINEIDDIVHGQKQGRMGMYNDIKLLAKQNRLHNLVKDLLIGGMDVYVTADHGNTCCVGEGKYIGAGVDVETKSHRMLVLKDFADKQALIDKYGVFEYPKYYLNHKYDYLICPTGKSLDTNGEEVMTHGGISIDEVIVPFISFKAGENNG